MRTALIASWDVQAAVSKVREDIGYLFLKRNAPQAERGEWTERTERGIQLLITEMRRDLKEKPWAASD